MKPTKQSRSWWLSDAQKIADENPYTFHKPSREAISMLKAGDGVKLIFRFESDDPSQPNAERMWVEITKISGGTFDGTLDNDPHYIQDIKLGDPVSFSEKHIIQVSIDDPVPSKTDRYLPRCFVTRLVLYENHRIGYLYREEPDFEEDSGWRFMAGSEPQEYMDDSENVCLVSLGAVLQQDDSVLGLLDSPTGSAFERDASTGQFVEIIE